MEKQFSSRRKPVCETYMVSIIVCTRNRAASLMKTLRSVRQLSSAKDTQSEIVIVDNGSTDDTARVIRSFAEESSMNVISLYEGRKGASYARNTALKNAHGELLAFTDDDMILDERWLIRIQEEASLHPDVSLFFGRTLTMRPDQPRFATKESEIDKTYMFPCSPSEPGSSNNMIVRRAALGSVRGFDINLGPGTSVGSGEDTDFTYRILRSGARVRYCSRILAHHDHTRLSGPAIRALRFVYGKSRGAFYWKHVLRGDLWSAKLLFWETRYFLRKIFDREHRSSALLHLVGLAMGVVMRVVTEIPRISGALYYRRRFGRDREQE